MINFFFSTKKKIPSDIPKWSSSDFQAKPATPFGNRQFFFLKFNLLVQFFGVKFTGNYHVKNTEPETPFGNLQFFFCQNLTYSYSFLGRNLPGITMSLESLHNYFGITVKSRKNHEKFGFFDCCL